MSKLRRFDHSALQTILITVQLTLDGSANPYETMEELAYSFAHPTILDCQIIAETIE